MYRKSLLVTLGLLFMIVSSGSMTHAQDMPYRVGDRQVEQIMHRLKKDADRYRKSLDSALDRSRLDGTNREDDINAFVSAFDKATETLHERFKDHKSVASDVQNVLDRAAAIDQFMRNHQFRNGRAERDWLVVRTDLGQLAETYNVTWTWQG
jgi:hypothetical protein